MVEETQVERPLLSLPLLLGYNLRFLRKYSDLLYSTSAQDSGAKQLPRDNPMEWDAGLPEAGCRNSRMASGPGLYCLRIVCQTNPHKLLEFGSRMCPKGWVEVGPSGKCWATVGGNGGGVLLGGL